MKSFLNTARQFSLQFVYQFDTIQVWNRHKKYDDKVVKIGTTIVW